MTDELIPIGEAARMLGVSVDTLRRWDATGRLEAIRVGGARCYPISDIRRLAAERATNAA